MIPVTHYSDRVHTIELDSPEGPLHAILARPDGAGPWPGVVVVHDALGITEDLRHQIDRLTAAGYLVLAPDLFSRGRARCLRELFRAVVFTGEGPGITEILTARDHLAADAACSGRIAVLGFCLGGGFALLTAPRGFDAAAPFYPSLWLDYREILTGACPIVASFGSRDPSLRGRGDKLARTLTALDVPHDVRTYPGATHGFANVFPGDPVLQRIGLGHDAEATEDAWVRIFTFFDRHLGTPAS